MNDENNEVDIDITKSILNYNRMNGLESRQTIPSETVETMQAIEVDAPSNDTIQYAVF